MTNSFTFHGIVDMAEAGTGGTPWGSSGNLGLGFRSQRSVMTHHGKSHTEEMAFPNVSGAKVQPENVGAGG